MSELMQTVGSGFAGLVNAVANFANSQGGNVANTINQTSGTSFIDSAIGAALIIIVAGIAGWKVLEKSGAKYLVPVVVGACLFVLFATQTPATLPVVQNFTSNLTTNATNITGGG